MMQIRGYEDIFGSINLLVPVLVPGKIDFHFKNRIFKYIFMASNPG